MVKDMWTALVNEQYLKDGNTDRRRFQRSRVVCTSVPNTELPWCGAVGVSFANYSRDVVRRLKKEDASRLNCGIDC
jgi:hypothetical protein